MNKRVYITLHGYKRPQWEDFRAIKEDIKLPGEVVVFDYYDSSKREWISKELWMKNIEDKLNSYPKETPITLIGYSMGGVAAMSIAHKYDNIDQIYAIVPAIKTKMMLFIGKGFLLPYYLGRKLQRRIKLGKEGYTDFKRKHSRGSSEPYPFKMTWEIHVFKMWARKSIHLLRNKKIQVVYADNDGIVDVAKSKKWILDAAKNNHVDVKTINASHRYIMDKGSPIYADIEKWVNENK